MHGDLTFENVLWDGHVVTALLDFEWSRQAPADVDLDVFLRFACFPYLHVAEDYEAETRAIDYAEVPFWLAEDYPELFGFPHEFDRLRLYSIAYDVRELLAFPPEPARPRAVAAPPLPPAGAHGARARPPRPAGRQRRGRPAGARPRGPRSSPASTPRCRQLPCSPAEGSSTGSSASARSSTRSPPGSTWASAWGSSPKRWPSV